MGVGEGVGVVRTSLYSVLRDPVGGESQLGVSLCACAGGWRMDGVLGEQNVTEQGLLGRQGNKKIKGIVE